MIAIPAQVEAKEAVTEVSETPVVTTEQKDNGPLKSNCRDMHRIERKETIYSISKLYGITEEELIAANPEIRNNKLKRGKFLCIPYAKGTSAGQQGKQNETIVEGPASNVELFKKHIGPDVKIKAAGGISSLDDAVEFMLAGSSAVMVGTANFTDPFVLIAS